MAREKEKLPQSDNTPEKKNNLSKNFEDWLQRDKQHNYVETRGQIASLRDDIKEQLRAGDPREALLKYPKKLFSQSDNTYRGKYGALASIQTGSPEDQGKTAAAGMIDSVLAPFQAAGRIVFDTGKFVLSPRKEVQNTLAYLKEESPHTEIV